MQAHILFSGRVQGVGFRYTFAHYARNFQLHGWVKNLANGKVEVLIEGTEEDIEKCHSAIKEYFREHITDQEMNLINKEDE